MSDVSVSRKTHIAQKVVFVDGNEGCGKTLFPPVISSLQRVELLTYCYEIEYICSLHKLGKIDKDAAVTMVRMLTDLKLYNTMMSREVNFRPADLSSAWRDAHPWRYIRRLFETGDAATPEKIRLENPILQITTHNILGVGEPVFEALGERLVFVEIVRHPLYKIKQQCFDMERILGGPRDLRIYIQHHNTEVPHWTKGWEGLFASSNNMDKVIYSIDQFTRWTMQAKSTFVPRYGAKLLTIPFECFVLDPWPYLHKLEQLLETKASSATNRVLKQQNVPRAMYAQGIALPIYKRCGWEEPKENSTEEKEFELRWEMAAQTATPAALRVLSQMCEDYEKQYLGGSKTYDKRGL